MQQPRCRTLPLICLHVNNMTISAWWTYSV